jgi:hypothetical protein
LAADAPPEGALLAPVLDAGALAAALLDVAADDAADEAGAELAVLAEVDAALVAPPALEPELLPHADAAIATRTPTDAT